MLPSPIVCDSPVEDSVTETLEKEIPRIFPSCVVTRAQAMNESREDAVPSETVFIQLVLIEAQEEAEDLKRPPHQIKPAPPYPHPSESGTFQSCID